MKLEEVFRRLTEVWEGQRSEIVTAEIHYQRYCGGGGAVQPFGPAEVNAILREVDLVAEADGLQRVIERIRGEPVNNLADNVDEHVFYWEGDKTRDESEHGALVHDGTKVILTRPYNNQVDVMAPAQSVRRPPNLSQFRLIPRLRPSDRLEIEDLGSGTIELREGRGRLVANIDTGFVEYMALHSAPGSIAREVYQFGATRHAGDIVFPKAVVHATYDQAADKLQMIEIFLIQRAIFNEQLRPEVFTVAVPAGTNIFDHRGAPEPRHRKAPAGILRQQVELGDVVDRVDARTNSRSGGISVLYVLAGVVGGASGLFLLWRRLRTRGAGQ